MTQFFNILFYHQGKSITPIWVNLSFGSSSLLLYENIFIQVDKHHFLQNPLKMVQFSSSHPLLACRKSVFIATVLSTVCLMSAVILLPIAHLHTQQRVSSLLANVDLCKMETRDVWRRVPSSNNRQRRDNNPYTRYSAIMSNSQGACCSCSQGERRRDW